ncbi:dTDP-4-dehydrorhamnose reductase [Flavobacterium tiangeerense]|uniref:dTDP-4-dehydrorhamnose reductase n=1 Tax=Flavobacterium tiangeerense TaxID=459471 RepID=A0ABY3FJL7_9FLAO|nr:dTDP-4-dehydrorhamnose reductase [Flavobacterium tiangeerense]TWH99134.1 dTDP-4-dehydrorhamnose reductase [Flavobacterium tiangeerense]
MKKILITGGTGQLGSELKVLAMGLSQYEFVFPDRSQLNLEQTESIVGFLEDIKPDCIINCAAYTAVDQAEQEPEIADAINHLAVCILAEWSFEHKAQFLHVSTDYVFEGTAVFPLKEEDATNPQNEYGKSKLKGEIAAIDANPETIIIRTSWVYSQFGANFVKTMLRLMQERDRLNVVQDQIGSPTYAKDLAEGILHIINTEEWQPGTYHYSNEGIISWFEFAIDIKEIAGRKCELFGISSASYPTPAKRPAYSLLNTAKIKNTFGITIPHYRDSLEKCIEQLIK